MVQDVVWLMLDALAWIVDENWRIALAVLLVLGIALAYIRLAVRDHDERVIQRNFDRVRLDE